MAAFLIKYGIAGIIAVGFIEGILLPFPMEVISLPIYLASPKRAIFYSLLLVLSSVAGSMAGYFIGGKFGQVLIKKSDSHEKFLKVRAWYDKNAMFAMLTSAVTPIPYEIYVLFAGVCKIDKKIFFLGSLLSRMIRHVPQGLLVYFGKGLFSDSAKMNSLVILIVVVLCYVVVKCIRKRYS